jgi:hypothetical protein
MGMRMKKAHWKVMAGSTLLSAVVGIPMVSQAQSPGDVIRIGNSPYEWSQYESYWNQLINLGRPAAPAAPAGTSDSGAAGTPGELGAPGTPAAAVDPQVLEKALIRNLRVSNLRLMPILKLNGSSQVMGSISNRNSKAVTVTGVNLEILDSSGTLVQTTSATPLPATVPPGGTVTFTQQLLTVPADSGFQVRLSRSAPFSIQGGV